MSQTASPDYQKLLACFASTRRSWKGVSALSGLVVVVIEALGSLALAALAQFLFAPSFYGSMAILAAFFAIVAYFMYRHIFSPLTRTISNQQLALYLEERNPQFEGALMAAAEFGPNDTFTGRQLEITQELLREAAQRAERFNFRKAVDMSRFRKYGFAAMALTCVYFVAALIMPETVGQQFQRVLAPWKSAPEQLAMRQNQRVVLEPLSIVLSRGDTKIRRGEAFDLEAQLSRHPGAEVTFHFRPLGSSAEAGWKTLPMKELEKLNTFQRILPDVNEDLEFFVSTGLAKTAPNRIAVYDPLVLKTIEVATKYPEYMKLPDRIETPEAPDMTAPVGSTITLRLTTNGLLQSGQLLWAKGAPLAATIDKNTATFSFQVTEKAAFQYQIMDENNQIVKSTSSATVTAVVDQPPTVKLLKPGAEAAGNPIVEILFSAEAGDDFGLDGGNLVVTRMIGDQAQEYRAPITFESDLARYAVTSTRANTMLALEHLAPPVKPGDQVAAYIEVRDRKGQVAASEICLVSVNSFEAWAFHSAPHAMMPHPHHYLQPVIIATWELQRSKPALPPKDFDKQAEYIAGTMRDPETKEMKQYVAVKGGFETLSAEMRAHAEKAVKFVQSGHDALMRHDTSAALRDLQIALVEINIVIPPEETIAIQDTLPEQAAPATFREETKRLTALMEKKPDGAAEAANSKAREEGGEKAREANRAEKLAREQAKVVEQTREAVANQQNQGGEAQSKATTERGAPSTDLAGKQAEAAKQAEQLAADVKKNEKNNPTRAAAAADLQKSAELMTQAAAATNQGKLADAVHKAVEAQQAASRASAILDANSHDRINQLLAEAAALGQELQRKQEDLLKRTQAEPNAAGTKQLAEEQAALVSTLQQLAGKVEHLQKIAEAGAVQIEAAKHVDEAAQEIRRARINQKMLNAIVELAASHPKNAVPHQTKALDSLAKVREELLAANDARAMDRTTALALAANQAKQLQGQLEKLGAKPPQPGKPEPTAAEKKGDNAPPASPERAEAAGKAADAAQQLARSLSVRDFAKDDNAFHQDSRDLQSQAANREKLSAELRDIAKAQENMARLTQRISDRLEIEIKADREARRLFDAQREECPPEYRQLVNSYFEMLSKARK